jgi:hypothetical protein
MKKQMLLNGIIVIIMFLGACTKEQVEPEPTVDAETTAFLNKIEGEWELVEMEIKNHNEINDRVIWTKEEGFSVPNTTPFISLIHDFRFETMIFDEFHGLLYYNNTPLHYYTYNKTNKEIITESKHIIKLLKLDNTTLIIGQTSEHDGGFDYIQTFKR